MANRTVLTWPCASLKKTSLVIPDDFFNKGLDTLVADMCDTLAVKMGSGLAAPQIGVNKRVIIVKATDFTEKNPDPYEKDSNIIVMVNPEVELSGEDVRWSEGCLSVPGFTAEVTR
jgi:peptide deformylase